MLRDVVAFLIGPFMRLWSIGVEHSLVGVPRPSDIPQAHAPGINSDRILLIGSGPVVGWGVLSHDLSLPGALARALAARTGRGAVIDVIPTERMTAATGIRALDGAKLWRYDAVVLVVGINDAIAMTSSTSWRRSMRGLLQFIEDTSSQSTLVLPVAIPPVRALRVFDALPGSLAEWHARCLNKITGTIVHEFARTTFIPFTPEGSKRGVRYRGPDEYREWAEMLAAEITVPLNAPRGDPDAAAADAIEHEAERQRAVDLLQIVDTPPEERFDRIVSLARRAFKTESAALTVIDNDRQFNKSSAGTDIVEMPRSDSICAVTIEEPGIHIIGDVLNDERFAALGDQVRFYAGFPVEAPSGERIGALCVFDSEPRDASEVDEVLLRELAMLVQAELWRN
ncbi:MAG: GAF domain-containing protein [Microbacteriaceae bacterium]